MESEHILKCVEYIATSLSVIGVAWAFAYMIVNLKD